MRMLLRYYIISQIFLLKFFLQGQPAGAYQHGYSRTNENRSVLNDKKWNKKLLLQTSLSYLLRRCCSNLHCKDTLPKIRNKYSQKWNCAASFPIPTFMYLWAIYIFLGSVCLLCCIKVGRQILGVRKPLRDTYMNVDCGNWERGCAV